MFTRAGALKRESTGKSNGVLHTRTAKVELGMSGASFHFKQILADFTDVHFTEWALRVTC